jgi:membrane protease YdiL (CAAX protease family)
MESKGITIENNSSKWKKILCLIMLFFYCSAITEPLNLHILGPLLMLMQFAVVIIMIPDLFRELKKIKGNAKCLILVPIGVFLTLGVGAILWDTVIMQIILSALDISLNNANDDLVGGMIKNHPVIMSLMVCIHGPIIEEILYRYTAFGILYKKNRFLAYLVSALLFGLQHVIVAAVWGGNPIQFLNMPGYIISGIIFAFLYSKSKTLAVPIFVHMIGNTLGTLLMFLSFGQ